MNSEKIKIAIFSSAEIPISDELKLLSQDIARYLVQKNLILVTGGSVGIPGQIIEQAHKLGGETIMFSPDINMDEHNERFDNHKVEFYNEVVYGNGFTSRSLEMIKFVDCALVLNGRTGTLCEFTIAVEEGLPVSVVTETGGMSDHLSDILKIVNKEFPNKILFGPNYKKQIDLLLENI